MVIASLAAAANILELCSQQFVAFVRGRLDVWIVAMPLAPGEMQPV
jgi:hypothetical protein